MRSSHRKSVPPLFRRNFSYLAALVLCFLGIDDANAAWHYHEEEQCCLPRRFNRQKDFISEFTCGRLFYKTLRLDDANGYMYVGAMDYVFRLNMSDIGQANCEDNALHLEATDPTQCVFSGKSKEYECRNHVRVIEDIGQDLLYICGTNAHSPRDLVVYKDLKHLPRHVRFGHIGSGVGRCPGSPNMRVAAAWVGSPYFALLSGTYVDPMLADRLFVRWDLQRGVLGYKRTARYNTKWLDGPEFIGLHAKGEHAYALVRERGACNRHESRVVRVCLNDQGSLRHPKDWTTFVKANLFCNAAHYHRLEDVYRIPGDDSRVYGLFTSGGSTAFSGSALCSFTTAAFADAFSGKFRENAGNGDSRQAVDEDKVPAPRPGACVSDTNALSDTVVNFVRSHPLMLDEVEAEFGKPLHIQKDVEFTVFVVERIENYLIFYCGTKNGSVYKILQWVEAGVPKSFLMDVWIVFDAEESVEAMALSKRYQSIYMASDKRLKQVKTRGICRKQYQSCARCSRDPYCGWNANEEACQPYTEGLFRDVENFSPTGCESFVRAERISASFGQSVIMSSHFRIPEVLEYSELVWTRKRNGDNFVITRSERYIITMDRSLVILGLDVNDAGLFECRWENRLIASYNLTIDEDRCVQPVHNGSYHRIYLDWCRQFVKHKDAMKTWQTKRKMLCPNKQQPHLEWTDERINF